MHLRDLHLRLTYFLGRALQSELLLEVGKEVIYLTVALTPLQAKEKQQELLAFVCGWLVKLLHDTLIYAQFSMLFAVKINSSLKINNANKGMLNPLVFFKQIINIWYSSVSSLTKLQHLHLDQASVCNLS